MKLKRRIAWLLTIILAFTAAVPTLAAGREVWGDWAVTRQPTCTRDGERSRTSNFGNVETETIYATGHTPGDWVTVKPATCIEKEHQVIYCQSCWEVLEERDTGSYAAHKWGNWQDAETPEGALLHKQTRTCKVCGLTEEREIDLAVSPLSAPHTLSTPLTLELKAKLIKPGPFGVGDVAEMSVTVTNTSSVTLYYSEQNKPLDESYPYKLEPDESVTVPYTLPIKQLHLDKAAKTGMQYESEFEVYYSKYKDYNYDDPNRACGKDTLYIPLTGTPFPWISLKADPAWPGPYAEGDKAEIVLTLTNESDAELTYSKSSVEPEPMWPDTLPPHGTHTCITEYTITKDDVKAAAVQHYLNYQFYNVTYLTPDHKTVPGSAEAAIPIVTESSFNPSMSLSASLISPPADGYSANDTAYIQITLENTCDKPLQFSKASIETTPAWPETLEAHDPFSAQAELTVTEEMLTLLDENGDYSFTLFAWYRDVYGRHAVESQTVPIPLKDPTGGLKLSAEIIGGGEKPYAINETVPIRLTATNASDSTLYDVHLFSAYGVPIPKGDLEGGKSVSSDVEYMVIWCDISETGLDLLFDAHAFTKPGDSASIVWAEPAPLHITTGEKPAEEDTPDVQLSIEGIEEKSYSLGDKVELTLKVHNGGLVPVTITGLKVDGDDEHMDDASDWSAAFSEAIGPGKEKSCKYIVGISSTDVESENASRYFSMEYEWVKASGEIGHGETDMLPVDLSIEKDGEAETPDPLEKGLLLTCESDASAPAVPGTKVGGKFSLTNAGSVPIEIGGAMLLLYPGADDENALDDLSGWSAYAGTVLNPGDPPIEVWQYTNVVNDDLIAGKVVRDVKVGGYDPDHNMFFSNAASIEVPLDPVPQEPEGTKTYVRIDKNRVGKPENAQGYVADEVIHYEIKIMNVSGAPLYDLAVTDILDKTGPFIAEKPVLDPSDPWVIPFDYTVTAWDTEHFETLYNQASVRYSPEASGVPEWKASNLEPAPLYAPPKPETQEQPEPDTPETAPGTPECLRDLTGAGGNFAAYTLTLCHEHAALENEVRASIAAAATDEARLAACLEGVACWRTELENLYRQAASRTDMSAWTVLSDNYEAFDSFLCAYEDLLKKTIGLDDATAALRVLDQLRIRCVDLCYALHHAPDKARPDSLVTGTYEKGIVSFNGSENTFALLETNGGFLAETRLAGETALIERGVHGELSRGKDSLPVFLNARMLYQAGISLRSAELALGKTGDERHAALLWQTFTLSFLESEDQLYAALYPDAPEVAAEIVCRSARDILAAAGNE